MAEKDIRQFAKVVGSRLDSPRMKKFLATFDAAPVIDESDGIPAGTIPVYQRGFDLVLAFSNDGGSPRPGGRSNVWAAVMRFFGPEYGVKRKITPYAGPILGGLTLPSTREGVRECLGSPTRSSDKFLVCDEYDQADCVVRFCYPLGREFVVFVELDTSSWIERKSAQAAPD